MNYVELPLSRIEAGKPVPVDIWDPKGNLLIRKGQSIRSEEHKNLLAAHRASATEADFKAWQRSYDRLVYAMLRDGASVDQIAKTYMPAAILDIDYAIGYDVVGGWLDLHDVLGTLLYQGPAARNALERLDGVQKRATSLVQADADGSLFTLFQALPDRSVTYSAKHALLSAVVCELTARKLQLPQPMRPVLFRSALVMNIAMAREQDALARQSAPLTPAQEQLIQQHPARGVEILRGFGEVNADLLELVAGHHAPADAPGLPRNLECRQVLCLADRFIAKMAARATRAGLSGLKAAKAMVDEVDGNDTRIGAAMTAAVGFYPPGTYAVLANGETAVVVRGGPAAHTPLVVSIMDNKGMALVQYAARDTGDKTCAVLGPVSPDRIKVRVNADKVQRAVLKIGR